MSTTSPGTGDRPTRFVPTAEPDRIVVLDVLRGFAVLGILVMNIQSFSMVGAAYFNPMFAGPIAGAEYGAWLVSHLLADQKFMTIFSLLFGAGLVLMGERAEQSGRRAAGVHYRRMFWLCVFGLLHAYLLWYGDILFLYGVCGMIAFWFRRRRARTLAIVGLLTLALGSGIYLASGASMPLWPPEQRQGFASNIWSPSAEQIAAEIAAYQGSWVEQMAFRVPGSLSFQTQALVFWGLWRALGLMLIGGALFKWGVITGRRSPGFYTTLVVVGFLAGLPVVGLGVARNAAAGWGPERFFIGSQWNYWGSLLVSAGWMSLVILAVRRGWLAPLVARLEAVGRLAFSNYLLQTLICTTIFYGHGLGLFGTVSRIAQPAFVLGVWIVALAWSPVWLRRFRYGPFEWAWRSLTYWTVLPIRR